MHFHRMAAGVQTQPSILHLLLSKPQTKAVGQAVRTSCNVRMWCHIALNNLRGHHFVLLCISWCYLLKRDTLMHCLSTTPCPFASQLHISSFLFFLLLSKPTERCPPDSGGAAAEPFCSRTHFHVTLTCQCAQNCQSLLKALDAMCNSFNTRPGRYPYHCCNGVLMPPCIPRACTRQLVIHLIYSTRPAVDQAAPRSRCVDGPPDYTAGHSAAFALQRWSQGHMGFCRRPEKQSCMTYRSAARESEHMRSLDPKFDVLWKGQDSMCDS